MTWPCALQRRTNLPWEHKEEAGGAMAVDPFVLLAIFRATARRFRRRGIASCNWASVSNDVEKFAQPRIEPGSYDDLA